MNQIDQLISQAGIQGTFDLRCLYRGGFRLPHAQSPAGVMPFHLLMKGEIRVSTAQGDDVSCGRAICCCCPVASPIPSGAKATPWPWPSRATGCCR